MRAKKVTHQNLCGEKRAPKCLNAKTRERFQFESVDQIQNVDNFSALKDFKLS